ncbi:MAG: mandelate racemase/muconate lactonizing enzyme family protein [Pseudorhodobacter sp.]|nr:mandelate racemase/muconate lactonizing enzyme family protein [Pseudorhodobacter sp.]
MATIRKITLRRLNLPLIRPYRLSYRTFETFEPFLVEVEDVDGASAFADAHVSPGSSSETREGGWAFLDRHIRAAIGTAPEEAIAATLARFEESKVATTALVTALEHLLDDPLLHIPETTSLPLLTPINQLDLGKIGAEVEDWLAQGFRTFKVKVGKDVEADLARVRCIQAATAGRAALRLDANRAFSREEGMQFAAALDPVGIELFEQPCDSEDWESNAAVARVSVVPLMLDEPICTLGDIERAGAMPGVGFCKLKLKRFGGLGRLKAGLDAVRSNGMEPVLGDGLGSEIHAWMEACVAQTTIHNAGEFNGFIKTKDRIFETPLPFSNGAIHLDAGFRPRLDREKLERMTVERIEYTHQGRN